MNFAGKFALALAALGVLSLASFAAAAPGGGGGGGGGMGGGASPPDSRDDPQAAYQAGVAALNAGNYQQAIRHFRSARRAAPNNGALNYALGLAYAGANETDDARESFERAARDRNAPANTRLQLGLIYLQQGDRAAASEQQAALAQAVDDCDAACGDARRTQLQSAHDQLTNALEAPAPAAEPDVTGWNFPSVEEGRAAYAEAVGLINRQRYAEAHSAMERAQAAVGPNADVLNYMGFVSRRMGRLDDALAYYNQALALDPTHLGATEYLGELYLQMGDMNRAHAQLAQLDRLCAYGCAEREELARWIASAE